MSNTPIYNFKKPEGTEFFNIVHQNDNWDIAEAALKDLEDGKVSNEIITDSKTDLDETKILKVGDYGVTKWVLSPIGIHSDANNLERCTKYLCDTTKMSNLPPESGIYVVSTYGNLSMTGALMQTALHKATGNFYTRTVGEVVWEKLSKEKNVVNKSGDTMTNSLIFNRGTGIRSYKDVLHYENGTTTTGTLKITMPKSWSNTMISGKIKGFEYQTVGEFELDFGGYNNIPTTAWQKPTAKTNGTFPQGHYMNKIRFAHDGLRCCILIGTLESVWSNLGFSIVELVTRFQNQDGWNENWSAEIIASEAGISNIVDVPVQGLTPPETIINTGFLSGYSGELSLRVEPSAKKYINGIVSRSADFVVGTPSIITLPLTPINLRPLRNVRVKVPVTDGSNVEIPGSSCTCLISTGGVVVLLLSGTLANSRNVHLNFDYY